MSSVFIYSGHGLNPLHNYYIYIQHGWIWLHMYGTQYLCLKPVLLCTTVLGLNPCPVSSYPLYGQTLHHMYHSHYPCLLPVSFSLHLLLVNWAAQQGWTYHYWTKYSPSVPQKGSNPIRRLKKKEMLQPLCDFFYFLIKIKL